jgi:cytochrome c oxidase assembly factor CtaG
MLSSWTFDPLGVGLALTLTSLYAVCLVRAHRLGAKWNWLRSAMFMILGVGTLVYATCGALAVHCSSLFWVAAVQAAVLSAVTPIGLALGDPRRWLKKHWGTRGLDGCVACCPDHWPGS